MCMVHTVLQFAFEWITPVLFAVSAALVLVLCVSFAWDSVTSHKEDNREH